MEGYIQVLVMTGIVLAIAAGFVVYLITKMREARRIETEAK